MPGKLQVTSKPPAAKVKIDNQLMNQPTPFTFVVSPGEHSVVLTTLAKCSTPKSVTVNSAHVTSINCDATNEGWGTPVIE
ncbi:MAG: PEGA domain-containing protein [Bryobacteraceae bacterium]